MRYLLLLSVLLLACDKSTTEPEPQPVLITTNFIGQDTVKNGIWCVTPYYDLSSFTSFRFSWTCAQSPSSLSLAYSNSDAANFPFFGETPASNKAYVVTVQPHQFTNKTNIRFSLSVGSGVAYNFKVEGFQ